MRVGDFEVCDLLDPAGFALPENAVLGDLQGSVAGLDVLVFGVLENDVGVCGDFVFHQAKHVIRVRAFVFSIARNHSTGIGNNIGHHEDSTLMKLLFNGRGHGDVAPFHHELSLDLSDCRRSYQVGNSSGNQHISINHYNLV